MRINNAACALGRARPCSQFSRVRTLVRRYFANKARDRFKRSRRADSVLRTLSLVDLTYHAAHAGARWTGGL